jgi:hypothetical protein
LHRIVKRLFSKGLGALMIPDAIRYTQAAADVRRTSNDSAVPAVSLPAPRRSSVDFVLGGVA